MVKKAFNDRDLDYLNLSSANSINIGRLIPQSMYYFYAFAKLAQNTEDEIIFSVPSGNFGDLMGGLIAKKMGLPVKKFMVSTNANDEVPTYFDTDVYTTIVPSLNCISSAMNVGHPSNMARIIALYGGNMDENGQIKKSPDIEMMKKDMYAVSINDDDTRETIKNAWEEHKLLLEPHGAVGWAGLHSYFIENKQDATENQLSVCLETAHPAKFPQEIRDILEIDPQLPESLKGLDEKEESFDTLENDYDKFKAFLTSKYL
jgi:threonine synthase